MLIASPGISSEILGFNLQKSIYCLEIIFGGNIFKCSESLRYLSILVFFILKSSVVT